MKVRELLGTTITAFMTTRCKRGQRFTLGDFLYLCRSREYDGYKIVVEARALSDCPERYREYKTNNVPCFSISCCTGIDKADVLKRNNIMCIDIDHVPTDQIRTIKDTVMQFEYVFCSITSLSGKGILVLAHVANNDDEMFRSHYQYIAKEFAEKGIEVDMSCTNTNRLRFLTFDDDICIKDDDIDIPACRGTIDDGQVQTLDYTLKKKNQMSLTYHQNWNDSNVNLANDDGFVESAIKYLVIEDGYQVNGYKEWFITGCRLATLPYPLGADLYQLVSERSPAYVNPEDVKRQFDKCVRFSKNDRKCLSYYFSLLKAKHGSCWVSLARGYQG